MLPVTTSLLPSGLPPKRIAHAMSTADQQAGDASTIGQPATSGLADGATTADTVETRLWQDEHQWLHALLHNDANVAPTFRMPDLVSACVSLVFLQPGAPARIFGFLGTQLVLRPPLTPRRREAMWRAQYELLLVVQRSPANRHPNPKFQLDQLTTACVALCQAMPGAEGLVLRQSRLNMAERASRLRLCDLGSTRLLPLPPRQCPST